MAVIQIGKAQRLLSGSKRALMRTTSCHVSRRIQWFAADFGAQSEIQENCLKLAEALKFDCVFRQTNSESELIDWIQEAFLQDAALIINPAGFSFGRIPVLDAVKLIRRPVVKLRITNIPR